MDTRGYRRVGLSVCLGVCLGVWLVAGLIAGVGAGLGACGGKSSDASKGAEAKASSSSGAAIGQSTKLEADVVARVAEVKISRAMVIAVAQAQHVSPEVATRMLVDDALLAEAARRKGALGESSVNEAIATTLARALVSAHRDEALAMGPVTDAELSKALTEGDDWIELARPETRKVVHALVPKDVPGGEAIARELRDRIAKEASPEAFLDAARAFSSSALPAGKLRVEALGDFFTEDGRLARRGGGAFAEPFTRAAFAIEKVGDTSPVVFNPEFGWHVIRLVAIDPPHVAPRAQQVAGIESLVLRARVSAKFQELLARLANAVKVPPLTDESLLMTPQFSSNLPLAEASSAPAAAKP